MIFVTSDLHFGHNKPFLYEPRGFSSIEEHDKEVIKRWNSIITPEDNVYILGDLMLGDNEYGMECLRELTGFKHIITGNHDTVNRVLMYHDDIFVSEIAYATVIKKGKWSFYLSHYPTKVGNYDDEETHRKFYSLCGHTHTKDKWLDFKECKSYHVELDAHNCYPVLLDDIIKDIKNYPL